MDLILWLVVPAALALGWLGGMALERWLTKRESEYRRVMRKHGGTIFGTVRISGKVLRELSGAGMVAGKDKSGRVHLVFPNR